MIGTNKGRRERLLRLIRRLLLSITMATTTVTSPSALRVTTIARIRRLSCGYHQSRWLEKSVEGVFRKQTSLQTEQKTIEIIKTDGIKAVLKGADEWMISWS